MAEGQPELHAENGWVEEATGEIGVIVYAKELSFVGGDDESCWLWHSLVLESQGQLGVEVPKLMGATHLEVVGKYPMSKLTAGSKYQVVLLAMLQDPAEGWDSCDVNVQLNLPDGTSETRKVNLGNLVKDQLSMVVVGHFEANSGNGDITYSIFETSDVMKKGLVIKDFTIRPLPPMPEVAAA